jgi:hypothetical protein
MGASMEKIERAGDGLWRWLMGRQQTRRVAGRGMSTLGQTLEGKSRCEEDPN